MIYNFLIKFCITNLCCMLGLGCGNDTSGIGGSFAPKLEKKEYIQLRSSLGWLETCYTRSIACLTRDTLFLFRADKETWVFHFLNDLRSFCTFIGSYALFPLTSVLTSHQSNACPFSKLCSYVLLALNPNLLTLPKLCHMAQWEYWHLWNIIQLCYD